MPHSDFQTDRWKLGLSLFWFVFTFSMVTWWWIFSLQQLESLAVGLTPEKYHSLKRMLLWEGSILLAFIFGGGLSLLVLTHREQRRNFSLRLFFSNFSHDLKTSLNRLRLRAEVMAANDRNPGLQKLMEEVSRLDLQLENSLWISRGEKQKLLFETFSLENVLSGLRLEWPDLEIHLNQDALILGDQQALQSIIRNLLQNAWAHGQATRVSIHVEEVRGALQISFHDNGSGFAGDTESLGQSFLKSKSRRGNGIGLFLTKSLLQRMQGQIYFSGKPPGFTARIEIPGKLKGAR